MRKLKLLGASLLVALVATGIAVANEGAKADTDAVSAAFQAERTKVAEKTCTGGDGTYRSAREEFRGTVTSTDPRLSGAVVLKTRSFVNQTTGLGTTSGEATVRGTDGKVKGVVRLTAVNTQSGVLEGVLQGRVKSSGDAPGGTLTANFHAQFSSATALAGTIGGGGGANTAVVQGGGCARAESTTSDDKKKKKGSAKAQIKVGKGEVTALSATALAVKVGDATVSFPLNVLAQKLVARLELQVGSKVEVAYAVKGDTVVLLKVRKVS
jgi:hypothetical protein